MTDPELIREAGAGGTVTADGKTALITIATPGWGSSGYYSAEVLKAAATAGVFPKGTQQHIDHLSEAEARSNPAGSLATLAAKLTENAYWNEADQSLKAHAFIGSRYAGMITEFADAIGVSMAAYAKTSMGEAEGKRGRIIEELLPNPLNRVDFVTVAGRGGKVDAVLESLTPEKATEAMTREMFAQISEALQAAYGGDGADVWIYLEDFDPATSQAIYTLEAETSSTFRHDYALRESGVQLLGEPVPVRRVVTWEPITAPANEAHTDSPPVPAGVTEATEPIKEDTVAKIEIEESELTALRESASRAEALEAEKAERAEKDRAAAVEALVSAEFVEHPAPRIQAAVVAEAISGKLEDAAITAAAREAAAEVAAAAGVGKPRGMGGTVTESAEVATPEDIIKTLEGGK